MGKEMQILIIDDDVFKYMKIKRAIENCRTSVFTHAAVLDQAKEILTKAEQSKDYLDLIVTDMNYPEIHGDASNPRAGFALIAFADSLGSHTPIIICSTSKFRVNGEKNVLGSIRYSRNTDLDSEFRMLIQNL